jgi:hypothetical protein
VDDRHATTLPVPRTDDSRVVQAVRRIPAWVFGVALLCLAVAALVAAPYIQNR